MAPTLWQPKHPTVSTSFLPSAMFPPPRAAAGIGVCFDFAQRYSVMALISATFRLSQFAASYGGAPPPLLSFHQNCGMRACDLNSFGLASHFRTQSFVSLPETFERS